IVRPGRGVQGRNVAPAPARRLRYPSSMCGRFTLAVDAAELEAAFELASQVRLEPRYNIAPTEPVAAVRLGKEGRELAELRWGLIPYWASDAKIGHRLINARAESAAEKPAFREAFRHRR